MNKVIFKTVLAIAFTNIFNFATSQTIDAKSKNILDTVTKNYKSKKNSYFKFAYTTNNGSVSKTETGIFYSADEKYKLKIMDTEQIFDGNKVYNINDEDKEVTIAKPNNSQVMFSPISYLESYKNDYNVVYTGKKNLSGIPVDVIKMTPTKSNGLKSVILYINTPQKKLIKLEQLASDNSLATINISNYKENQVLSKSIFSFDKKKYQNYMITEL